MVERLEGKEWEEMRDEGGEEIDEKIMIKKTET